MKIAINGYGNLGRGVEAAVTLASDMELVGVFTRRDPQTLVTDSGAPVYSIEEIDQYADQIDVMVLCGGSATDLPTQTPEYAARFNVVDSFDTHAKIPQHFGAVDQAAREGGKIGIISVGWDPGLFSLARLYASAALPGGNNYTFWGRGVSQGHSDAIRRIEGVADARQYTVPVASAVQRVRDGENPVFETRDMHTRDCYVVAEPGADLAAIEQQIVTMPNYFDAYDTTVTFVSQEELDQNHSGLPHGGTVIRSGRTGTEGEYGNTVEFSLALESNPFFTGSVLAAAARAAYRLNQEGQSGARTMFDLAPALLYEGTPEELRAHLL